MATVKLQDGKVVIKDGRVSCSCCEANECCVYPASCGLGPESVLHYGSILSGSGTTFGDTTNGVILEGGVWAVYRNGLRTEKNCLGMAIDVNGGPNPESPLNVGANLATSYELEVVLDFPQYTTLSFSGAIPPDAEGPNFPVTEGHCTWDGIGFGQLFDTGLRLFFDPTTCRWVITDSGFSGLYAYREDDSPMGVYIDNTEYVTGWTVS